MPKRSNAFQKLIFLVNQQLAKHGHVVESPLLTDTVTGELREVDVLIETSIAGYEIKLAIECIDRKRKADTPWIEGILQKHKNLPTDKLILVSRSGFSVAALKKAEFYNLPVFTLEDAIEQDWLHKIQSLTISSLKFSITNYTFQLIDTLENATIGGPLVFYDPEGHPGDLISIIRTDIISNLEVNKFLHNLLIDKKDSKEIVLAVDLTTGINRLWYILDSAGKKHRIKWFRMHVGVTRSETTKDVGYSKYGDSTIAFVLPDDNQSDLYVFFQSRDGSITGAMDSLPTVHESGKRIFAEFRFLGDQLLKGTIKE